MSEASVVGSGQHTWLVAASNPWGLKATRMVLAPSATDVLFEIVPLWRATYPRAKDVTVTVTPVIPSADAGETVRVEAPAAYEVFYPRHWQPAGDVRVAPATAATTDFPPRAASGFSS